MRIPCILAAFFCFAIQILAAARAFFTGATSTATDLCKYGMKFYGMRWIFLLIIGSADVWAQFPLPMPARPSSFPLQAPSRSGIVRTWGSTIAGAPPGAPLAIPSSISNVVQVASIAFDATAALLMNGSIVVWTTANADPSYTNVPANANDLVQISGAHTGSHFVGLRQNGTVLAWGWAGNGPENRTYVPTGISNIVQVAAGNEHTLALKSDGTVLAWGGNYFGNTNVPYGLANVVSVATGATHSLALKSDGSVAAWGSNSSGQCAVPSGLSNVVQVAAGYNFSLALKSDGTVVQWGERYYLPSLPITKAVQIGCGAHHAFAVLSNRTVVAWGDNQFNQTNVPADLSDIVQLAGGYYSTVALVNSISVPPDSDNDGVNDYREGKDGTDPNNSASFDPLSKGLVAYYPFAGNGNDESGRGNNLTLAGANLTLSKDGSANAALQVGGNQSATSERNVGISGNADFTMSFWMKPTTHPAWPQAFVLGLGAPGNGSLTHFYYRPYNADANLFMDGNGPGAQVMSSSANLTGTWSHIMVGYNSTTRTFSFYLNGSLQTTKYLSYGMEFHNLIDSPLLVATGSGGLAGILDDIRIYNRAFSESEVSELFYDELNVSQMVYVQGGTLPQGSALAGQVVGDFQIGKYEVTWGEWKSVLPWAVANGYSDLVGAGVGLQYTTAPITSGQNHVDPSAKISGKLVGPGELSTNPSNSGGRFATAKLDSSKALYLKGDASYGGTGNNSYTKVLDDVVEVHSVAEGTFVALTSSGLLKSYGNWSGGNMTLDGIKSIATSASGFVALDANGKVYKAGAYQTGSGDGPPSSAQISFIFAGGYGGYGAIDNNGNFWVWGSGSQGRTDNKSERAVGVGFEYGNVGVLFEDGSTIGIASSNFTVVSGWEGKNNHPVHSVNWFDVVKWCNAKSEKEGLNPVYFSSNSIYKTGQFWNFESGVISMRTSNNGYRLPLEKEWEWSARGGVLSQGFIYSGSNDLNAVGWYSANSQNPDVDLYQGNGTVVRFNTNLGAMDIELFDGTMPATVENFLNYVRGGNYTSSLFHRSTTHNPAGIQIVQGGGFFLAGNSISAIPTDPPIALEPSGPNLRGTIAMARTSDRNSATSQWFFNVTDNPSLDGNYAVFGKILDETGLATLDSISSVPVYNVSSQLGGAFWELPLNQPALLEAALVSVASIDVLASPNLQPPLGNGARPVGQKLHNELGIYDMSGNLWEWCWEAIDWNELGYARRIRGGSWSGGAEACQTSFRITGGPHSTNDRYTTNGFRLARNNSGAVQPATPTVTTLPTASVLIFGQALSNSTLTGGVAGVNGTTVAGSFAFASPSTVPTVGNSTHSVVFTPTDSVNYTTATANVTVTVSKAGAVISTLPSASSITFGQALSSSVLTGGAANVAGSFAFASPSAKPAAGNSTQGVVFTPSDSGNYTSVTANVTVRVLQAVPVVSAWPSASPLKFGQALSASVLSGGSANVAGSFGFVNLAAVPPLGLTTQAVRFAPADSGNYTTLSSNVTVTVDKAAPVISSLPTASAITEGQSLAASVLTGGSANVAGSFAFALPGTVPAVGNSTHGVVFSPVDAGNYTVAAGNVTVRVNALPSFSLNTTSTPGGNVTASAAGPHKQGSTVTLTAVPDGGFVFVRWAGNATGTANPLSLTVGGNLSVVAIFSQAEPADTNVQEFVGGSLLGVGPSGSVAGGANGVAAAPDGGMVSVGDFTGSFQALGQNFTAGASTTRAFTAKHGANGTLQWVVAMGANGTTAKAERVAVDAAGNVLVAGTFTGTVNFGPATHTAKGNADVFVARLGSNGTVQWVAVGGGTNAETVNGLLAGADGEAYVTGGYFGANATFGSLALASQTGGSSNRDAYLGRISSNGTWQWVVAAGGSSTDQGRAVAVRDAGSLWWGGNFQGSAAVGPQQLTSQGATDIFVAAVDAVSGNTTSPMRFGGTGEDALTALVSDRVEGFYASGSFASAMALGSVSLANSGVGDGFVARWQKNAGWTWGVALQGGDDDLVASLAMDAEGRLYAGGYFASESLTAASNTLNNTKLFSYDGFVARFTPVGGVKWLRGLRGDNNDYVRGVACVSAGASTGALQLVGYTESALSGDALSLTAPKGIGDAFFVRMNPASAAPSRTVTVNPSVGGTVALSPAGPSYPLGTQVTLTPVPAAGFGFLRWGGWVSGNATPLTITVNQSVSIDAEFADIGAPLVAVTSPAEGMQLPSAKVDFTGTVTDNVGVASAVWGLNGVEKGNLTLTQNGSFSVPAVPLVPGDNLFTVVAVDAAGNEAVEEVLLVWSPSRVFSLPATASVNEGRTLKIPVRLTSEGGVGGFRVQVNFDPAVFSSANFSFTGQAALGESLWTSPSPGRVDILTSLGGGSISGGIQQIGELTLRARSVPLGGLSSALQLEVKDVSNNLGNPLLDGTGSSGCTATVRSRSLPADINGNGFIDSGDGALLKSLILDVDASTRPWDVSLNDLNTTNSLDSGDLTRLLRIVVGLDPKPAPLVLPQAIRTASIRTMSLAPMSVPPAVPGFFLNNGTRTPIEVRVSGDLDDQTLLAEVVVPAMGSALNSLEFEMKYPADLLQVANALRGEAAPGNAEINAAFGNGLIRFAASNNSSWASDGGTVMRVTFTRNISAAAGSVRHLITLENLLAFTAGGYDELLVFQRPAVLGRQMQNWLGAVVSNAPADVDSDGDGMTNRQEFLAGTDPNDRGSRLKLDGFLHDPAKGEQTLTWRAKRGVRYRVQSSENLNSWTTDNSTELLGNDGDVSLSIKPAGNKTKLFYRLQVVE